ncbi:MAG: hypothetical protein B6I34_03860 [Anaerolineaceae bacterium 4572_32.1]|nr:MAG: hypothetical protein B6I34_03860 [Anaerolineaceae bacterium 4572_32.1]
MTISPQHRNQARATVWRPDVGSIAPAMTASFSNSIVTRFPSIGDKYRPQPPEADAEQATEMTLSEKPVAAPSPVAAPFSGGERRSAPSSPRRSLSRWAVPAGQQTSAPARPPVTEHHPTTLPQNARLFSRVEEMPQVSKQSEQRAELLPSTTEGPVQRQGGEKATVQTAPSLVPEEPPHTAVSAPPVEAPLQRQDGEERAPIQTVPASVLEKPLLAVVSASPVEAPLQRRAVERAPVQVAPPSAPEEPPSAVVSAPPVEAPLQRRAGERAPIQAAPPPTPEEPPHTVVSAPPVETRVQRHAGQMRLRAAPRRRLPLTQPSIAVVQRVTAHLEARGYRFKRKRQITPAPPSQVARAAAELERGAGAGSALAEKPRAVMESALGQDFGAVRVHTAQLAPLGVQAASRGSDVYVGPGQDRFDTPDSLSLLGHELTHVSQQSSGFVSAKPAAQMTVLPVTRSPVGVARDEDEADSVEQSIKRLLGSTALTPPDSEELPSGESKMELWESGASEEEGEKEEGSALEDAALSPDELAASPELFLRQEVALLVAAQQMASGGEYPSDLYQNLLELAPPDLDAAAEEGVISIEDVEAIGEMAALLAEIEAGQEKEEPEEAELNLGRLARQVYPFVKQMLAVERERMAM